MVNSSSSCSRTDSRHDGEERAQRGVSGGFARPILQEPDGLGVQYGPPGLGGRGRDGGDQGQETETQRTQDDSVEESDAGQ